MHTPISERKLIAIIASIQFINIMDFMMVMPLGPDFARALGIPAEHIGIIGGTYTFAAAITGLIAALFLDRFNRKSALLFCLAGLILATAAVALAWDLYSLLLARAMAGIFGGPLTSVAISMVADFIAPEHRGRAMGRVMGAFAAASIFGVPFGLELSQRFDWRAPFVGLACMGIIVWIASYFILPNRSNILRMLTIKQGLADILYCLRDPLSLGAFAITSFAMIAGFMIVPNVSAHIQMNLGYPRDQLGLLYFCGGFTSFFGMRWVGNLIDNSSATFVSILSTVLLIIVIATGFVWFHNSVPVLIIFVGFMVAMTSRNVSAQTLSSKVPRPDHRASFMSLQSSITHFSSALGAFISSQMLSHQMDGRLYGIENVGKLAILVSLFIPVMFFLTESRLKQTGFMDLLQYRKAE